MHEPVDYALGYAKRGWPVAPLYWWDGKMCTCGNRECHSPAKHPIGQLVPNGLKDATTDAEQIRAWWKMYPSANVAIVTGEASGLVVLDVDDGKNGFESLSELCRKAGIDTETKRVKTGGGGAHLYYSHPGYEVRNSAGKLGDGLDVRGDGGYVVAPPSNHASGRVYEWATSRTTPTLPMPEVIGRPPKPKAQTNHTGDAESIPSGRRNEGITALGGAMRRYGFGEDEILAALLVANARRCNPPLDESEVQAIARSVSRYEPGEALDFAARPDTAEGPTAVLLRDVLIDTMQRIDEAYHSGGALRGINTGFEKLNEMTAGFQRSELFILAARPSQGKTTLACNMARTASERTSVAVFSVEMARGPLSEAFLSSESGVDGMALRTGKGLLASDLDRLSVASGSLGSLPIWINDDSFVTVDTVRRTLRWIPDEIGIVFVDYLQMMKAEGKFNREDEAIATVSMGLKAIAKEFDVPVVALAQLSRKVEDRAVKRPVLSDLRGSGQIEQDADTVAFLHCPDTYGEKEIEIDGFTVPSEGVAEINIAKQRHGPIGTCFLYFNRPQRRFENYAGSTRPPMRVLHTPF